MFFIAGKPAFLEHLKTGRVKKKCHESEIDVKRLYRIPMFLQKTLLFGCTSESP